MTTVIEEIANCVQAMKTCTPEWYDKHMDRIEQLTNNYLPHGSGLDGTVEVVLEESKPDKIVIFAEYHHMDRYGYYDGWTEHKIIVRPTFGSFDIRVTGRNRNDIKSYLGDLFAECLSEYIMFSSMSDILTTYVNDDQYVVVFDTPNTINGVGNPVFDCVVISKDFTEFELWKHTIGSHLGDTVLWANLPNEVRDILTTHFY